MKEILTNMSLWFTRNLFLLKSASIAISVILLAGIIYLVVKTQYFNLTKEWFMDAFRVGNLSRSRALRSWRHILKHLRSSNSSQWRTALLESDRILDEILKLAGYYGDNLDERLANITVAQLANIDDVRKAHALAEKIRKEEDFLLDKHAADEAVYIYRSAFRELRLID